VEQYGLNANANQHFEMQRGLLFILFPMR